MLVQELETPVPVIDLDIVERNLQRMQKYADESGLKFRPHIKTHKIPEFALRQVELGAVGITCQKIGEAEVMADAGLRDILLSYPQVGVGKPERLGALASRVKLSVGGDSKPAIETAAAAARIGGAEIRVFVEFDSGAGRTGVVSAAEALALAKLVLESPGLRFGGLMTYPMNEISAEFYLRASATFSEAGVEIPSFSAAATPMSWASHTIPGLSEIRHGTYIYYDRSTVAAGAATFDDCAVQVHATVISRPTPNRVILDSGSKTLSSDRIPDEFGPGYGLIREYPKAVITRLYEEHALVAIEDGDPGPSVGERVRVLPNHVCVVSNLHDEIPAARNGVVEKSLKVAARGKTR